MKKINEQNWFERYQDVLLWLANTDYGRDLLCIDKSFPRIKKITPNYIQTQFGKQKTTEFRIGNKWGKVIRHRWKEFLEATRFYYEYEQIGIAQFPLVQQRGAFYLTTTAYPDPDPETSTVDGRVYRDGVDDATWATIRAGAGTGSGDAEASATFCSMSSNFTNLHYDSLIRGIFLFDTSGIGDTDTIDSGTMSINGTAKSNDSVGWVPIYTVYTSTPVSNTALASGDFSNIGTTAQSNDISNASWSTTGYNDWTLNATGLSSVSKTGITKFAVRERTYDADAGTPTWESDKIASIAGTMADTAGTATDPKLVIQHTAAAAFTPQVIIF